MSEINMEHLASLKAGEIGEMELRPYTCVACGHEAEIKTNHCGEVFHICKGCSWMMNKYEGVMLFGSMHRKFECQKKTE